VSGDPDHDDLIGEVLASRYCLEEVLGVGAMGVVYRARHVEVGRSFAIKILHARFSADDRTRRRFAREATLAGTLHHANVVNVVDVGELADRRRYLVMEYADGPTLLDLINETAPMASARVLSIVGQLCAGLQHAHELGLIHRDFKPDNVIVECDRHGSETPRIVDFGIAILRDDAVSSTADRLTTRGLVLGTPHYMAPEHATAAPIDHRIDLFALGVTCYEMLTGQSPFEGDGVDVARANLLSETPAMNVRVPGLEVDPLLEAFTRKLMMKSRDDRPATAQAARALLELIERDRPAAAAALGVSLAPPPHAVVASPAPAPAAASAPALRAALTTEQRPPVRSHPARFLVPGGAALAVIVTMAIALYRRPPRPSGSPAMVYAAATRASGSATAAAAPLGTTAGVAAAAPPAPAAAPRSSPDPRITRVPTAIAAHRSPHAVPAATAPASPPPPAAEPPKPPHGAAAPSLPMPLTAAGVAQLYGSVGRQLKALDETGRTGATADLWPQYLQIRINDVIGDPDKLAAANATLFRLESVISRRASQ
jgi:protein kinase-like protein